jgi:hypothetical protein
MDFFLCLCKIIKMIKLIMLLFSPYIWIYKKLIKKEDGNLLGLIF